ncbi:hypothetical protein [Phaeovulum vinaykumarii]|uniref:hypothetical protein n=1 Tax=Phaeovulum vinaykumarii TaxID=407234 RepID=UPI00117B8CFC|nr:hypothetical protein [Phaeovulum vinaykumarii]
MTWFPNFATQIVHLRSARTGLETSSEEPVNCGNGREIRIESCAHETPNFPAVFLALHSGEFHKKRRATQKHHPRRNRINREISRNTKLQNDYNYDA